MTVLSRLNDADEIEPSGAPKTSRKRRLHPPKRTRGNFLAGIVATLLSQCSEYPERLDGTWTGWLGDARFLVDKAGLRMWSVFRWLGIGAGSLSLIMLAVQAANFGVAAPLQLLLNLYDAMVRFLLDWTEPYLMTLLWDLFGSGVRIIPDWKDVAVMSMALFGVLSRASTTNPLGLVALLFWGIVVSITVSVAMIEHRSWLMLGSVQNDNEYYFTLDAILIAGLTLYCVGTWIVSRFRKPPRDATSGLVLVITAIISVAYLAFLSQTMLVADNSQSLFFPTGVVDLLAVFYFVLACAFLLVGALRSADGVTERGVVAMFETSLSKIGLDILSLLGGVLIFLITNAGLKLAGL